MIREENNLLKYFSLDELNSILKDTDVYNKALRIVSVVFENKTDKSNKPYINHLLRVSDKLKSTVEKTAGLLHDIVEDTEVTFDDLIDMGFSNEIIDIIRLVTKDKIDDVSLSEEEKLKLYNDEIDKIISSQNMNAINVKYSDMSDNYNLDRLSELPPEKQQWFHKKYKIQLEKLRQAVKGKGRMLEVMNYMTFKYKTITNKYTKDLSEEEIKKRYELYKKYYYLTHSEEGE